MVKNNDISFFFNPKSIAVVGASATLGKVGYNVLKNIIESKYSGKLYSINPNGTLKWANQLLKEPFFAVIMLKSIGLSTCICRQYSVEYKEPRPHYSAKSCDAWR